MRWRTLLTGTAAALLMGSGALVAQDTRSGMAVMPFENGGSYGLQAEDYDALRVGMQQMLTTEFAMNGQLRVVDRSRIAELLKEQDLGASGRVDAATAAKIGKVVGAKYMVMGGFIDTYGTMRLDIQIVDVETTEIVKADRHTFKREEMARAVIDAAAKITKDLSLPSLPREVQAQREERAERMNRTQAVSYYTKGLLYQDRGDTDKAKELFSKALAEFPDYTEAQEALRQVGG
jgi:TolB-like protein